MHAATKTPLRILIVDDHEIMREGLARILVDADAEWHTVTSSNGHDALQILSSQAIDLAIIDLAMPGMRGLDLIKRIHAEYPKVPLLVLSMFAQEQYTLRALRAGAKGYVTKDVAGVELVKAVCTVAAGGVYVSPSLIENVVLHLHDGAASPRHERLSDREMDVLRLLVAGERLTEIGKALHVSVKTISTHKSRILEKLELRTIADLVRYGIDQGLVDYPAGDAKASPVDF